MPAAFDLVTIDSPQPAALAAFWSAALRLVESEHEDDGRWIVLSTPGGERRLGLQRGASRVDGGMHLDLRCTVDEFDGELRRLLDCGAVALRPSRCEVYGQIANLADPDGNPFDLCAYEA